jgi:hypothetical protein
LAQRRYVKLFAAAWAWVIKQMSVRDSTEVVVPGRYPRTLSDGRTKHLEVAVFRVCCVSLVCKGPFVAVFNPRHALPDIG